MPLLCLLTVAILLLGWVGVAWADTEQPAYIAIIIDDLGNNKTLGLRATRLPGAVACAILPHTRFAQSIAEAAHTSQKEVLLHLPMESVDHEWDPGPGKLDSAMPPLEIAITLEYGLASVPHAAGVNNHMGSLLTQNQDQMRALMQAIGTHTGLYFLDSLTTSVSAAPDAASHHQIPFLSRDIFLDNTPTPAAIEKQLQRLLTLAKRRGSAIGIGHPYTETLTTLERLLPTLASRNILLVSPSQLLSMTH